MKKLALAAATLVLMSVAIARMDQKPSDDGLEAALHGHDDVPSRELQVTAARGPAGFAFTSKESVPATDCRVEAPDGPTTWVSSTAGVIPPEVAPSQTVRIGWDNFGSHGQRMPEYIGLNQKRFNITCRVNGTPLGTAVGWESQR